jgi:hypothetical protein
MKGVMSMSEVTEWKEIEGQTSKKFVEEIQSYVTWAENAEQAKLLNTSIFHNSLFVSVVIVTSENIIQLIFNKEDEAITIGTASRDACEHAAKIWNASA